MFRIISSLLMSVVMFAVGYAHLTAQNHSIAWAVFSFILAFAWAVMYLLLLDEEWSYS